MIGQTQAMRGRSVWERVREALKEAGLPDTQVHAAKLAGVKQPTVWEWSEPGKYPKLKNAVQLADRIGICVEWLYTERGPKRPGPIGDSIAQELWAVWPRLPITVRAEILGFAKAKIPSEIPSEVQKKVHSRR